MLRLLVFLMLLPVTVLAGEAASLKQIKQHLQQEITEGKVQDVRETPISGLYEVTIDGFLVYMSADGRYVLQGDIVDRKNSRNITKLAVLETINDKNTIVFKPKKKSKYTLTVFTDVDCGYCRKLHQEVPKLTENGVKVRYMLFPRAGEESGSAQKLENVWCAKDQQEAMTLAKQGAELPVKDCDNPIKDHLEIGRRLGLRGTPFILTGNGSPINGYAQADRLISILEAETLGDKAQKK